jgi:hypothetical protein
VETILQESRTVGDSQKSAGRCWRRQRLAAVYVPYDRLSWYGTEFNVLILGLGEMHMGLKLMGCKLITSPSNLGGPVRAHRQHARELGAVRMRDGGRGSGAWARHRQRHTGEEAAAAHGRGGGAWARRRRQRCVSELR